MTADPRAALSLLVAALERHLETAAVKRGDDDPAVVEAYERIAAAFTDYDDALMEAYGEVTPLDIFDEDDDDEDLDDEDDDDDDDDDLDDEDVDDDEEDDDELDDDGTYVGLDDEEFDVDRGRG
ncbi:hypothetical protein [Ornithinimicrobium tianjinense]|uniref:Primosomal protein n=1 Tax=Ornithinimicrobium tianjinense TaxID=1195761 RepID=A0A917BKI6_9MICO|nr:hypothetical protein [Ornithinimicrobium tianjinense]GGF47649.1 hypothetical protein GCM10011366_14300 [Ornithinimicrobium tianjinense]